MSEQEQIQSAAQTGEELDEAALEAVAGGGIISDVVDYCVQKINEAGQQLMNAANGGGTQ